MKEVVCREGGERALKLSRSGELASWRARGERVYLAYLRSRALLLWAISDDAKSDAKHEWRPAPLKVMSDVGLRGQLHPQDTDLSSDSESQRSPPRRSPRAESVRARARPSVSRGVGVRDAPQDARRVRDRRVAYHTCRAEIAYPQIFWLSDDFLDHAAVEIARAKKPRND